VPESSTSEGVARKHVLAAVFSAILSSACGKYGEVDFYRQPEQGRPNPGVGVGRAEVVLNRCPQITSLIVSPLETGVGGIVTMQASAEDPEGDPVSLSWSVTRGEVERTEASGNGAGGLGGGGASGGDGGRAEGGADGGSAEGTWIYQCTEIGFPLLTLEASDARGCSQARSVGVGCVAPP
jgi:hypothetical protein